MKVNVIERLVSAVVISGVLLIGSSLPANAQENSNNARLE